MKIMKDLVKKHYSEAKEGNVYSLPDIIPKCLCRRLKARTRDNGSGGGGTPAQIAAEKNRRNWVSSGTPGTSKSGASPSWCHGDGHCKSVQEAGVRRGEVQLDWLPLMV